MKELDDYFALQKQIHEYFGYKEDYKIIPLDDCRTYYWLVDKDEKHFVRYAVAKEDLFDEEAGNYYECSIYTQRFLPKWVYRGKDYTMVCSDTHTDGNKFLQVFSNDKEVKWSELFV